ncbi:unnamed protein product [Symbiodinium necroappetens]|uniref:Uncharacterized protein n=1 Tax=Symbiodinium necroappetens TaxID=1628268 RepID=A0A812XQN9_9DINO|nr:unnamed protein product [Symbiodinium necroappetens]
MGAVRFVQSELGSTNSLSLRVWSLEVKLSHVVGPKSSALIQERPFDSHTLTLTICQGVPACQNRYHQVASWEVLFTSFLHLTCAAQAKCKALVQQKWDLPHSVRLKLNLCALRLGPRQL